MFSRSGMKQTRRSHKNNREPWKMGKLISYETHVSRKVLGLAQ